ncbi:hypothetical protein PFISCL1PPCAC_9299, partial [Pristionchus fissidentatus]
SQMGYKTMMAENWSRGVFNWPNCKGFDKQPTTHYMREAQCIIFSPLNNFIQGLKNCYEPHHFINDYMQQFMNAYPNLPKIAMSWESFLGHDSANHPFHADGDYLEFFKRNREEIDNSFLFFMGDHGLRVGKISETSIGQLDIHNPMMMVSVPRRLRNDAALIANLKTNSHKLLSMFDVHATFVDISESFSGKANPDFSKTTPKKELKGSSFLRPLPEGDRNCKTLPIPFQYCICRVEKEKIQ